MFFKSSLSCSSNLTVVSDWLLWTPFVPTAVVVVPVVLRETPPVDTDMASKLVVSSSSLLSNASTLKYTSLTFRLLGYSISSSSYHSSPLVWLEFVQFLWNYRFRTYNRVYNGFFSFNQIRFISLQDLSSNKVEITIGFVKFFYFDIYRLYPIRDRFVVFGFLSCMWRSLVAECQWCSLDSPTICMASYLNHRYR